MHQQSCSSRNIRYDSRRTKPDGTGPSYDPSKDSSYFPYNGRSLARTYNNHMIFILAPKRDSRSYGAWTLAYYITPSA